jgi:putative ABC transport system substrate-binding protein
MKRRDFIALLGSAAAAWPLAARAQQRGERFRRIGVLMNFTPDDPELATRITTFTQALEETGWIDGRNVQLEVRWAAGNMDLGRRHAADLVALAPDVILAQTTPIAEIVQQATRTIPIIFVAVTDPVGTGLVPNLARPGGNTTGFTSFEYGISAKWLELLKEIAPHVKRALVLRDPVGTTAIGQLGALQSVAPALGVELFPVAFHPSDIEGAIAAFASSPDVGLIMLATSQVIGHRKPIIALADRYRLPAVYPVPYIAREGGLVAYGPDTNDQYRRAAGYVDRVLKGQKPAELPVQAPTKYELVINLRTAKALGLAIPDKLIYTANEVIE